ncbi:hypothetical protein [Tranquillimonas alkanivorans]|uniref:Uncharacterized protein n=1 Tax=Tranquillimonas alkanivorans TaxID=441119 RepID=A0A1I5WL64_9RHOB|nr:hypothetical protein [Tranquillimonas alkanivorans]SFQ20318.1 hypothetical protein SAMN04488047_1497 [Tranquillimonas alkanivorans]
MAALEPGQEGRLVILRSGERTELPVRAGLAPGAAPPPVTEEGTYVPGLGATVRNLAEGEETELGVPEGRRGVLVLSVDDARA